jgi:hypothetical protein
MFFDSYKFVPNETDIARLVPAPLDAALGIVVSVALSAVLWEFIIPLAWWLAR